MKKFFLLFCTLFGLKSFAQKVELRIPIGHTGPVQSLSVTTDNLYLATGASDKTVKIWSIAEGREIRSLQTNTGTWYQLKFLADNTHLVVRMESGWEYWNALTGEREYQFLDGAKYDFNRPFGFVLSENGKRIAVTSASVIEIHDVTNGKLIQSINWQRKEVNAKKFTDGLMCMNDHYFVYAFNGEFLAYNLQTSQKVDINVEVEHELRGVAISSKNNQVLIAGYGTIFSIDLDTKRKLWEEPNYSSSYDNLFSADGKYIIRGNGIFNSADFSPVHTFSLKGADSKSFINEKYFISFDRQKGEGEIFLVDGYRKIKDFANETSWLQQMKVNNDRNELIFTTDSRQARIWDLKAFRFTQTVLLDTGNVMDETPSEYHSYFSKGENYVMATYSRRVVVNYYTGKTTSIPPKRIQEVSPDGTVGFSEQDGVSSVIDLVTGNVIKTLDIKSPRYFASPDNKTVLYHIYPEDEVYIYNYRQDTKTIATIPLGEYPVFNSTGTKLYSLTLPNYSNTDPLRLIVTEMPSGSQLNTLPLKNMDNMKANHFAISKDEKYAAVLYKPQDQYYMVKGNVLIVYEIAGGKEICRSINVDGADEIQFINNNLIAVMSRLKNTINIYNSQTCKHLLDITHFKGINDWIAVTPEGFYDGNMESLKKFYYVKGNDIVDPDLYFEKFYIPNLFARLINGEEFKPDNAEIKNIPLVKMTYPAVQRNLIVEDDVPIYQNTTGYAEITVNAKAPDDAVDEIRLFHNGKIVTLTARNLIVADDNASSSATKKYSVNLLPGKNIFRAVALNTQRTESKPDIITIVYGAGNTTADTQPANSAGITGTVVAVDKNATLYLIAVGINEYQNKKMRLNYALADATSFKEEVEKGAGTILNNIKTFFVKDNEADKAGIVKAFDEIKQKAKPSDVFIFYYAGHGIIGKDKEFYLVPANVSDLKNVQEELEQKGIAAKMLQQYAIDIQAQKQLFILDACQSAGAFETMMTADANQQKSIAVVARSTGTHWIAASGAQQFANEFSSLGHGAFTYVLLEALKGAALNNRMITVNGLKNYLQKTVPELMRKYHGSPQYPSSYGFGNDFPVEVLQ